MRMGHHAAGRDDEATFDDRTTAHTVTRPAARRETETQRRDRERRAAWVARGTAGAQAGRHGTRAEVRKRCV